VLSLVFPVSFVTHDVRHGHYGLATWSPGGHPAIKTMARQIAFRVRKWLDSGCWSVDWHKTIDFNRASTGLS
jgi:hypothetical protein